MVICDHSELLQTISDLQLENKQLRKQDKHREKIWKKRVAELQARITGIKTITVWNLNTAYKDAQLPNATTMIVLLTDLKKLVEGDK